MKTAHLSVISIVLGILSAASALQISQDDDSRFTTTKGYRKVHDDFYKMIKELKPVEEALNKALTWDVEAQYEHFELLEEHVKANDKYAEYCNEVIKGAQELLDVTLDNIKIKIPVDIRDYIKGLYDFEAGRPISKEMQIVIKGINEYRNKVVKELEEKQTRVRAEAEAKSQEESKVNSQEPSQFGKQDELDQAENQKLDGVENQIPHKDKNHVSNQAEIPAAEQDSDADDSDDEMEHNTTSQSI